LKDFESEEQTTVDGLNGIKYVIEKELDLEQVKTVLAKIQSEGTITSLAVVLMHAYAVPNHENAIELMAREVFGFSHVSISSKVMQRVKLVKRGQTCCVDAYLNPHIHRYLSSFVHGFDDKL